MRLDFKALTLLLVTGTGFSSAATISFTSAPGAAVPDNSSAGVNLSIVIPATSNFFIVAGNSVTVALNNMNHTYLGDLRATLTGAGGITRTVFDRPGVPASTFGCSGNFSAANTYSFNSGASSNIGIPCTGTLAGGTFRTLAANDSTNTNLSSAWSSLNVSGTTWTLNLADLAASDVQGAGWTWTLTLNYIDTPEPSTILTTCMGIGLLAARLWRRSCPTKMVSARPDGFGRQAVLVRTAAGIVPSLAKVST